MLKYSVIANDDDDIRLTKQEFSNGNMYSLDFYDKGLFRDAWDNDEFIFGNLYNMLKNWKNRTLKEEDLKTIGETGGLTISEQWVDDVLELIEEAIKLGWNND